MNTEKEILTRIREDEWMMNVLRAADKLKLPDWWICAGFVRSKVWDVLHSYVGRTALGDIDVVYFDKEELDEEKEKEYERQLNRMSPNLPWSVKNQARMHALNSLTPYQSSIDAISKFPETATAIGVKLDEHGHLQMIAPHGLNDLLAVKLYPTPSFEKDERLMQIYKQRLVTKDWMKKWPKIEMSLPKEML